MNVANDNEPAAGLAVVASDSVLPPEFREVLDQCDRVGIGMDVIMNIFRARLYDLGFEKTDSTDRALAAFRKVIERYR